MATEPPSRRIERRLTTLFPSTALEDHAEAVGVVERDGKFQIPALVWTLVFGFAAYLRDLVEFALDEVAVLHAVSDEFDRFRT